MQNELSAMHYNHRSQMIFNVSELSEINDYFIGCYDIPIYGWSKINWNQDKHYLLYEILNVSNNKYYVGQHITNNPNDYYFGSGSVLKAAKNKYGISSFVKIILHDYSTPEELDNAEFYTVQLSNCMQFDAQSYNIREGGWHGAMTEERKAFNRKDSSNRKWVKHLELNVSHFVSTEELQSYFDKGYVLGRIIDQSGNKNPIHKHVFTAEERKRISDRNSGINNPMYGKNIKDYMTPEKYEQWKIAIRHRKS